MFDAKNAAAPKPKKNLPAWAKTEVQNLITDDEEIDDLIEFAYELDYEQFMNDMEVK